MEERNRKREVVSVLVKDWVRGYPKNATDLKEKLKDWNGEIGPRQTNGKDEELRILRNAVLIEKY